MIFPHFKLNYEGITVNEINYELLKKVHQLKPVIRTQVIGVGAYLPENALQLDV